MNEYNPEMADAIVNKVHEIVAPDRSELYKALAIAQGEIEAAEANQENPHFQFRYADLSACLAVIRAPLSKNGLCIIQLPSLLEGGAVQIETILAHESGQSISCQMSMHPEKGGPQAIGSCMTYLRRYSLCIVGVSQVDDDANLATKKPDEYDRLTARDIDEVLVKADELFGDDADEVLNDMLTQVFPDKHHLADIPADQLKAVLRRLTNAKKKRDKKAADTLKASAEKKGSVTKSQPKDREPGEDDE